MIRRSISPEEPLMKNVMRWFARPRRGVVARRRPLRPSLDGLEPRWVLSAKAPAAVVAMAADLNTQVVNFAKVHLHQKVGGGECAHLANEALRVAGATFSGADLAR